MSTHEHTVTTRPFADGDVHTFSELCGRLWYPELSPTDALLCGEAELCVHLSRHTFGLVAEVDGEPMGVTLVRFGRPDPTESLRWEERLGELIARDGERRHPVLDLGLRFLGVESSLAAEVAGSGLIDAGDAEGEDAADSAIELLAVSPAAQGLGIGGRLLSAGRDYLLECGAENFYLITDDECDWSFYDHKGLRRTRFENRVETDDGPIDCFAYLGRL